MARKSTSLEDYKTFLKELQGPDVKPVYAFFGEETFFMDRLQDAAIATIPEDARDFNLDILYGLDITVDRVVDMCRSYPMMAERRVVIVRDFMKMFDSGSASGNSSKEEPATDSASDEISLDDDVTKGGSREDLVAYLKQPNPTTLLFLTNEKRPAANTVLGKALRKSERITSHTFEAVPDYLLQHWITEWASDVHNLRFEENAAQFLGYHVGTNLLQLTVEIEKLASYRKDESPISVEDVRKVVGLSREYTMFEFQDALFDADKEKAMFIAHRMIHRADSASGEVIKMISFLYTTFGKIWHIQRLLRKGHTTKQIREATGIKSTFYFDKLVNAGRHFPLSACPRVFEVLLDADKAIKGFSRENPEAILLMTVKKLIT